MSDLFLLSERQMAQISPHFSLAHGVPRVDERRVVSAIVYVIRNGLQWKQEIILRGRHQRHEPEAGSDIGLGIAMIPFSRKAR
jgi:transposase